MYVDKEEEDEEKGGDGWLIGSSSSAAAANKRQRFYIEIKHGETAIVSWKKLLRDATILDANSNALRDEKLRHRTKRKSSNNKQHAVPKIESPKVEDEKNDTLSGKFEECRREYRLSVEKAHSIFQKYLTHSDTSAIIEDHHHEGLHDVPVMFSTKCLTYSRKLNPPSPVNNLTVESQSQSSGRRFAPLHTYRRSKNLMETKITRNPVTATYLKRKVTDTGDRHIINQALYSEGAPKTVAIERPSLLPHISAERVEFKPSTEGHQPQLKERKMEGPKKTNMKFRFPVKPDHQTRKSMDRTTFPSLHAYSRHATLSPRMRASQLK